MTICLVIQKDTLENDKVKSILKIVDEDPESFVNNLQEGHCIPYQLVAHTTNNTQLFDRVINVVKDYKTNYGKDWYELDHDVLSKVISLFLETDKTIINFKIISSIFGFSLNLFPVVTKEIKIVANENKIVANENKKEDELVSLIENLKEDSSKRRKDKKTSKRS